MLKQIIKETDIVTESTRPDTIESKVFKTKNKDAVGKTLVELLKEPMVDEYDIPKQSGISTLYQTNDFNDADGSNL